MKTISKLANKKLQKGCCLQQWLSLSSVVCACATLRPCHCSMNFFTSNPVMFLASEPHISQRLSPLILNHASAHCWCAAPSSSLQPQPSSITSEPGTADSSSSGPRWQIRHPSPGASAGSGSPSTSMTTASVGRTVAGIGGEAPAAVGAAATASRRMRRSGSGQRVGACRPRRFRTEATATGGRAKRRQGAVYERESRRGTRGWCGWLRCGRGKRRATARADGDRLTVPGPARDGKEMASRSA